MKLISLNIWGGKAHDALIDFVRREKDSTDIFCFQEVWTTPRTDIEISRETRVHILAELQALLDDFSSHFFPVQTQYDNAGAIDLDLTFGQAIFVRKSIPVLSSGQVFTFGEFNSAKKNDWSDVPTAFGFVRVPFMDRMLTAVNFHGIAFPANKLDTLERLEQSGKLLEFILKEEGDVVLAGDFNLMPETESVRMFEPYFENLIKEYGIKTTRSTLNPFYGTPEQQNFADYTFVSKGLAVESFDVPKDCVASDHLPMILRFSRAQAT